MKGRPLNPLALALVPVMTSITFVLTYLVRVPTPARGYVHLGDAGVFFGAFAFGPWIGAVSGGLGTLLSDVVAGYPQWALFSLLIHGLQGWVVGWTSHRLPGTGGLVLSVVLGGVIVVGGYFGAGVLLSGMGAAVGELPLNILQVTAGALIGIPLYLLVRAAYPPINRWNG
jgi:uncharacterized membrane protein